MCIGSVGLSVACETLGPHAPLPFYPGTNASEGAETNHGEPAGESTVIRQHLPARAIGSRGASGGLAAACGPVAASSAAPGTSTREGIPGCKNPRKRVRGGDAPGVAPGKTKPSTPPSHKINPMAYRGPPAATIGHRPHTSVGAAASVRQTSGKLRGGQTLPLRLPWSTPPLGDPPRVPPTVQISIPDGRKTEESNQMATLPVEGGEHGGEHHWSVETKLTNKSCTWSEREMIT